MKHRCVNVFIVLLLARTIQSWYVGLGFIQSENEDKSEEKSYLLDTIKQGFDVISSLSAAAGEFSRKYFGVGFGDSNSRPDYPPIINIVSSDRTCGDIFLDYCQSRLQYRTIDGSCNNLQNPTWGMAETRFARLLPAIYSDGIHAPPRSKSNRELPPARTVSFTMFPEVNKSDPKWTLAAMQYGQIIAHDMASRMEIRPGVKQCCNDGRVIRELPEDDQCMPLIVPENDPDYKQVQCLAFTRSDTDLDSFCPNRGYAEQLTSVTHYLDLSVVYGSNDQTAQSLRSGYGGRLNVDVRDKREWPPRAPDVTMFCSPDIGEKVCYAAGDNRINSNTQLTVLHIILMREHNRVAGELARINPHWTDETIYQETRRIVIAMNQQIAYYEWLPIYIGEENSYNNKIIHRTNGYVDDYNPWIDPSVLNEHSTGAFRVFHSLIAGYLKLINETRGNTDSLRLSDWYMQPEIIEANNNMDDLTRGLATQPQQMQDEFYDKEITRHIFGHSSGGDLRAIDIQRGRDHGLATYNDYRALCGLPRAVDWQQFTDAIDQKNIDKLKQLYESPEDVDLAVGGALELLVPGTLTGRTIQCIMNEQFYRTRVGDRFWFESSNSDVAFTIEQLKEIRKSSLAKWFCDNGDNVKSMQSRAFELPSENNPVKSCRELPEVNLSLWKDYAPKIDQRFETTNYPGRSGIYYKK